MGVLSQALDAALADQDFNTAVFEIGGSKFTLGAKNLTPMDFSAANAAVAEDARKLKIGYTPFQQDPTNFEGQIALLVRKVRVVVDGELSDEKAFDASDLPKLRRSGVEEISTLFADLFKNDVSLIEDDDEEAVGNSKPILSD